MNKLADLLPTFQPHTLTGNLKLWCDPIHNDLISDPLIIESIDQCNNNHIHPKTKILKQDTRRCIVRVDANKGPLIIKSFPFTKLKEKLKYKKYGLAEITNNIKARGLGITAPSYYAYFESRRYGLVQINGCIMECLDEHTPLEEIYGQDHKYLHIAIPVLKELFNKGVNHIDISPSNIFFQDNKTDFSIIDWQYCSFHTPNDPLQLAVHAAHFLRGIKTGLTPDLQTEWLEQLYLSSNPDISKDSFLEAVGYLQNNKLSIKDRLTLNFDRDMLFK